MYVSSTVWIITLVAMAAILVADMVAMAKRPHTPSMRECVIILCVLVALALGFAGFVGWHWGGDHATEFIAGWMTEYSLSIDNLFIFLIIMSKLQVPRQLQQFALLVGVVLALVFRGVFIALGAAVISAAAWVFFLFGLFLLYTAFGLVRDFVTHDDDDEGADNALMRWFKRRFPATDDFAGTRLTVRHDGRRLVTPMLLVIVALGTTDVMFALDSIPAIYGLTNQPYIVFTANVFALMGLRQLYFLIGGLLKKLVYLPLGLAVLLSFIGVKLLLHAASHYHLFGIHLEISTVVSLAVIVVTLTITTVASLLKTRGTADEPTPAESEQEAVYGEI